MVCLAAAVLTKSGKVLIARQFVEMPRMRIENLLATFPKLVGADKQHNTVETAEVRYVYQPIENLMVLLMTNKLSNIVADLELLRLFAKARPPFPLRPPPGPSHASRCGRQVLTEYCPGEIEEANVCKHAFELVFAFDEVVAMGHKENVTMRDIQINIEMESHEEKLGSMAKGPPWAVPELGSDASSERTLRLWAAQDSQGERQDHWAPRSCLGCTSYPPPKSPICIVRF